MDIAQSIVGQPQQTSDLLEVAPAIVLEHKIGAQIVSHDDVRIAVVVEIGTDHTHAGAKVRSDA